jgi:hypothetical protein
MKNALFAAFALFFVTACGPNAVGRTCQTNADCSDTYSCFTQVAGGFCSRGCTAEGETSECPTQSACARVAANTQVCSPICTDDAQCGTGLKCGAVNGFAQKVCRVP